VLVFLNLVGTKLQLYTYAVSCECHSNSIDNSMIMNSPRLPMTWSKLWCWPRCTTSGMASSTSTRGPTCECHV